MFVVVVFGGMGSLVGAFIASLIIGMVQTFSVALDHSFASLLAPLGINFATDAAFANLTIAQTAPVLPYLLMVLMLIVRPKGLMGTRET